MAETAPQTPAGSPLRVLVVDDEALARRRVVDLLRRAGGVEVSEADGGGAAVDAVSEAAAAGSPFDVVFLDVQMPQVTGLDVVRAVGPEAMPVTVFVTAYDQHALAAFELAALDYLVKPFDDDRFAAALARAREAARLRGLDGVHDRLRQLLGAGVGTADASAPEAPAYASRLAVDLRGQTQYVDVGEVDALRADGDYVEVRAGERAYLLREPLRSLEGRLDPAAFFRVHRSAIVRLGAVEALLRAPGGDYAVRLVDGTRVPVSRRRREALEAALAGGVGLGGARSEPDRA